MRVNRQRFARVPMEDNDMKNITLSADAST